ncbi:MAG: glycoside hydrolase family 6 protein [Nocardioides sp.]
MDLRRRTLVATALASVGAVATSAALAATPAASAGASAAAGAPKAAFTVPMPPPAADNPTNPLAGLSWGVYQGSQEQAWAPYVNATGATKDKLGVIANAPKAKFFGAWISDDLVEQKMRDYIANATGGDPDVLVQFTLYRMVPWGANACTRLPTLAERASYRAYVDAVARAVGDTRTAVVLQPDGPKLGCVPNGSKVPARLLRYAARTLEGLPRTVVYLEMGSADWFSDKPARAARLLRRAGVADTRGFALDSSHFDSVGRQIRFGRKIVNRLAADGIPDAHFVIDTSDSGHPFQGRWWTSRHPGQPLAKAQPCDAPDQTHCVALGIPPTTDVANPAWRLSDAKRATAARLVDAYLWISRPWLVDQSGDFSVDRAVRLVDYSPFQ